MPDHPRYVPDESPSQGHGSDRVQGESQTLDEQDLGSGSGAGHVVSVVAEKFGSAAGQEFAPVVLLGLRQTLSWPESEGMLHLLPRVRPSGHGGDGFPAGLWYPALISVFSRVWLPGKNEAKKCAIYFFVFFGQEMFFLGINI